MPLSYQFLSLVSGGEISWGLIRWYPDMQPVMHRGIYLVIIAAVALLRKICDAEVFVTVFPLGKYTILSEEDIPAHNKGKVFNKIWRLNSQISLVFLHCTNFLSFRNNNQYLFLQPAQEENLSKYWHFCGIKLLCEPEKPKWQPISFGRHTVLSVNTERFTLQMKSLVSSEQCELCSF